MYSTIQKTAQCSLQQLHWKQKKSVADLNQIPSSVFSVFETRWYECNHYQRNILVFRHLKFNFLNETKYCWIINLEELKYLKCFNHCKHCWIYHVDVGLQYTDDVCFVIFAFFNVAWATLYLEHWKRRGAVHAYRWGTMDKQDELLVEPRALFHVSTCHHSRSVLISSVSYTVKLSLFAFRLLLLSLSVDLF